MSFWIILMVFFSCFSDIDYVDTWKAMEKLPELGLVKSIGISNFNSKQIDRLLANCRIKPVTNQVIYWTNNSVEHVKKMKLYFCLWERE